ncbi:hypothetical protein G3I23_34170, partial [Streptomyces sp. SID10115]|nr:hypothetical protein [Streptomyces sp. SID10115]
MTGRRRLRDIEARHPVRRGAKSPMQTIRIKAAPADTGQQAGRGAEKAPQPVQDLLPLLAGAAVAVGGVGAVLALVDLGSPLRAPFTLFFLL